MLLENRALSCSAVYSRARYQTQQMVKIGKGVDIKDIFAANEWHEAYGEYMKPGVRPPSLPDKTLQA